MATAVDKHRHKISRTTSADAVEIFGLDEFKRALRFADNDMKKAIKASNKAIAEKVVADMKRRGRIIWSAEQYETIIPSIRAVQGTVPKIRMGGSRKATVSRRYPSGRRRREIPSAGDYLYGAEFGGRGTKTTMQFPFKRNRGYVLFPTIRRNHGFIKREFTRNVERQLRKLGD
tara:strand:+ start:145 stop:666 length:522 start_codon:yes stop_codon:yes gene_type:complete